MAELIRTIDLLGGVASRRQLLARGVDADALDVAVYYGRRVRRVRTGWFSRAEEPREVVRAWRVGGRLTCVSALAYHQDAAPGPVLHVEVPARAAQLRDPDDHRKRLTGDCAVVVHWARHPGPGNARAVSEQHAEAVAAVCGVRGGVALATRG